MRKIAVVTGSRAEYGLLKSVIKAIDSNADLSLRLIVTGSHLNQAYGLTVKEIEADGFSFVATKDILSSLNGTPSMGYSTGVAIQEFDKIFNKDRPDIVVVLGDRYESFAACTSATLQNIPIAHIHGGELTFGAVDDALRHSMTKMSYLHFTSAEIYRNRVISMGEHPDRVFNVGALANDGIGNNLMDRKGLELDLGFKIQGKAALVTLHSETRSSVPVENYVDSFLAAIEQSNLETIIFTGSNADKDGEYINQRMQNFVKQTTKNCTFRMSLGQTRYLSMLNIVDAVVGNSSSAMIEAPILGVPTVNVGNRQKGRIVTDSILCCPFEKSAIKDSIDKALLIEKSNIQHPFGVKGVGKNISDTLASCSLDASATKEFYE